jgi:transcriptional regulator with XRE-family HTH domain
MRKKKPTITESLRTAIQRSGLTGYRVAQGAGVPEPTVRRLIRGGTSIRLDKADRLAAFLGLQLVPDPEAVPPEPTPENRARPMLARKTRKRKAN